MRYEAIAAGCEATLYRGSLIVDFPDCAVALADSDCVELFQSPESVESCSMVRYPVLDCETRDPRDCASAMNAAMATSMANKTRSFVAVIVAAAVYSCIPA